MAIIRHGFFRISQKAAQEFEKLDLNLACSLLRSSINLERLFNALNYETVKSIRLFIKSAEGNVVVTRDCNELVIEGCKRITSALKEGETAKIYNDSNEVIIWIRFTLNPTSVKEVQLHIASSNALNSLYINDLSNVFPITLKEMSDEIAVLCDSPIVF